MSGPVLLEGDLSDLPLHHPPPRAGRPLPLALREGSSPEGRDGEAGSGSGGRRDESPAGREPARPGFAAAGVTRGELVAFVGQPEGHVLD